MDEKHEILKAKVENAFERIKDANKVLEETRKECDHPSEYFEEVNYMTRPGQFWPGTIICGLCKEVIELGGMGDPWTCDDCGNSVYNCKCT